MPRTVSLDKGYFQNAGRKTSGKTGKVAALGGNLNPLLDLTTFIERRRA
jgi:hypothetical protein